MNAEEFLEHYDIRNDTIYSRNEEAHLLSHLLEAFANYKTEQLQKEVERLKQTIEKQRISYLTKCELTNKEPTEVKCEDGVPFPKKVFNKIIQREDE